MKDPSQRAPSRRMRQRRGHGPHRKQPQAAARWPVRLLLLALVLAAVLAILLRMVEFTGRRVPRRRFHPAPISSRQAVPRQGRCPRKDLGVIVT